MRPLLLCRSARVGYIESSRSIRLLRVTRLDGRSGRHIRVAIEIEREPSDRVQPSPGFDNPALRH